MKLLKRNNISFTDSLPLIDKFLDTNLEQVLGTELSQQENEQQQQNEQLDLVENSESENDGHQHVPPGEKFQQLDSDIQPSRFQGK